MFEFNGRQIIELNGKCLGFVIVEKSNDFTEGFDINEMDFSKQTSMVFERAMMDGSVVTNVMRDSNGLSLTKY